MTITNYDESSDANSMESVTLSGRAREERVTLSGRAVGDESDELEVGRPVSRALPLWWASCVEGLSDRVVLMTFKKGQSTNDRQCAAESLAMYTMSNKVFERNMIEGIQNSVKKLKLSDVLTAKKEVRRLQTVVERATESVKKSRTLERARRREVKSSRVELCTFNFPAVAAALAAGGAVGAACMGGLAYRHVSVAVDDIKRITKSTLEIIVHMTSFLYGFTADMNLAAAAHFGSFVLKLKDYYMEVAPKEWAGDWEHLQGKVISALKKSLFKYTDNRGVSVNSLRGTVDVLDFLRKNYTRVLESDLARIFRTTVKYVLCILYGSLAGVKTWGIALGGVSFMKVDYSSVDITDLGKFILDTLHFLGDRLDKLISIRDSLDGPDATEDVMSVVFDLNPDQHKLAVEHATLSFLVSQFAVMSSAAWVALVGAPELQACHAVVLMRLQRVIDGTIALSASKRTDSHHVAACMHLLRAAQATYASAVFNNSRSTLRKAPFSVHVSGPSAVGKSTMMPTIVEALLLEHLPEGQGFAPSMIGKVTDQKHDNNIDSASLAVVADDIFQSSCAETNRATAMKIFQLQNNMTSTLDRAAVEEKGRTVANPLLLIVTSNSDRVPRNVVQCTRALARRFHHYLRMDILPEFTTEGGMLDTDKIGMLPEEERKKADFYKCFVDTVMFVDPSTGAGMDYKFKRCYPPLDCEYASLSACVRFLNNRMVEHLTAQGKLLQNLNNPRYGLCAHGKHMWTCSACFPVNGGVVAPFVDVESVDVVVTDEDVERKLRLYREEMWTTLSDELEKKLIALGSARPKYENSFVEKAKILLEEMVCEEATKLRNGIHDGYASDSGDDESLVDEEDGESESKFEMNTFNVSRPKKGKAFRKRLKMVKRKSAMRAVSGELMEGVDSLMFDVEAVSRVAALSHPVGVPFLVSKKPSMIQRQWDYMKRSVGSVFSRNDNAIRAAVAGLLLAGAAGAIYLYNRKEKKENSIMVESGSKEEIILHSFDRYVEPSLFSNENKTATMTVSDFQGRVAAMLVTLNIVDRIDGGDTIRSVNGGYVTPSRDGKLFVYTSAHFDVKRAGGTLLVRGEQLGGGVRVKCDGLIVESLGCDTQRFEIKGPSVRENKHLFAGADRVWRHTLAHADLRHVGHSLMELGRGEGVRGHTFECASRVESLPVVLAVLEHYNTLEFTAPKANELIVLKGGVWNREPRRGDCGGVLYASVPGVAGGCGVVGMYVANFVAGNGEKFWIYTKNVKPAVSIMTGIMRDALYTSNLYVANVDLLRGGAPSRLKLGAFGKVVQSFNKYELPFKEQVTEQANVVSMHLNRLVCYGGAVGKPIPVQSFQLSVFRRPGFVRNEELLGPTDHCAPNVGRGPGQVSVPDSNMRAVRALAYNSMVTFDSDSTQTYAGECVIVCVPVVVSRASMDRAAASLTGMLEKVVSLCGDVNEVFTALPAINVLNGIRGSIPRLNFRSSSGFAGHESVGRIGVEVKNVFDEVYGAAEYQQHTEKLMVEMEEKAMRGELEYVTRVLLKHEPMGKNKKFPRCFYASPLVWQLLLRRRLGKLYALFTAAPLMSELSIGVDPVSSDWGHICEHLHIGDASWHKFGGDFANFDISMPKELLETVVSCIFGAFRARGASKQSVELAERLMQCVVNPTYIIMGEVYKMAGSHPSGYLMTVLVNGFVVSLLLRQCFYDECEVKGVEVNFEDHVRVITGGDDHVVSVSQFAADNGLLNACLFGKLVRSYGWNYTDPNKNAYSVPFSPEEDIDFLKRSFGEFSHKMCGKLAKKSIKKSLLWGLAGKESQNIIVSGVIRSVMREAVVHGIEYYDTILLACRNMVDDMDEAEIPTGRHLVDVEYRDGYERHKEKLLEEKFTADCGRFQRKDELELREIICNLITHLPVCPDDGTLHGVDVFTSSTNHAQLLDGDGGLAELHSLNLSVSISNPNTLVMSNEDNQVDIALAVEEAAPVYNLNNDIYTTVGRVENPGSIPNREFFVGEYTVTEDEAFTGLSLDIPHLWRTTVINNMLHVPFKYVMEYEVRIVVSAYPYHSGLLVAYMLPSSVAQDPLFVPPGTSGRTFHTRSCAYQYPHVEIDLCRGGEYTIRCKPIVSELPLVLGLGEEGGSLHVVRLTPVFDTSNEDTYTPVKLNVYARALSVLFEGKTELNSYVPIGEKLAKMAKKKFGTRGVTSTMLDAAGGALSRAMGFARPISNDPLVTVAGVPTYGVVEGPDVGVAPVNSLYPVVEKPVDTVDYGEMELLSICERPGFMGTFSFPRDVRDILICMPVQPFACSAADEDIYTHTPLGYVSTVFKRWRGSIKYKFKIVAPATAVGVLSVVVDPFQGPASRQPRPDRRTSYNLDLSVKREIEVCVPWHSRQHTLTTLPWYYKESYVNRDDYIVTLGASQIPLNKTFFGGNGVISLMTIVPVAYPISVNAFPDFHVVVTVSSDDIEFYDPYLTMAAGFGLEINSLVVPPDDKIMVECDGSAGSGVAAERLGYEHVSSVKQLLQRYTLHTVNNYAATTPNGTNQEVTIRDCCPVDLLPYGKIEDTSDWYDWFDESVPSPLVAKDCGTIVGYLHWFRPLYYCMSGGMKFRSVVSGPSSFPSSISGRWAGAGTSSGVIATPTTRITYDWTTNGSTPFADVGIDRWCGSGVFSTKGSFDPSGAAGLATAPDQTPSRLNFVAPDRSGLPFRSARAAHRYKGSIFYTDNPASCVTTVTRFRPGVGAASTTYMRERLHVACADDYVLGSYACTPPLVRGPLGLTS